MKIHPSKTTPPADSRIAALVPGAYFCDAWSIKAGDPTLSALGQFLKAVSRTPRWVDACMSLRNRAVTLLGLKDLGALAGLDLSKRDIDYQPGDRVGIFTLYENTFTEALLGDKDKHLDVTLSVHRSPATPSGDVQVTITTLVQVKNLLGRAYMLPVTPMHRLIAPTVLRAVARDDTKSGSN
jgi:hypothetical protein